MDITTPDFRRYLKNTTTFSKQKISFIVCMNSCKDQKVYISYIDLIQYKKTKRKLPNDLNDKGLEKIRHTLEMNKTRNPFRKLNDSLASIESFEKEQAAENAKKSKYSNKRALLSLINNFKL